MPEDNGNLLLGVPNLLELAFDPKRPPLVETGVVLMPNKLGLGASIPMVGFPKAPGDVDVCPNNELLLGGVLPPNKPPLEVEPNELVPKSLLELPLLDGAPNIFPPGFPGDSEALPNKLVPAPAPKAGLVPEGLLKLNTGGVLLCSPGFGSDSEGLLNKLAPAPAEVLPNAKLVLGGLLKLKAGDVDSLFGAVLNRDDFVGTALKRFVAGVLDLVRGAALLFVVLLLLELVR